MGSIMPTAESDIGFEVWLPAENWNGKFMQTGNGGAAGVIVYGSLADALARGYAVANTDTGHRGGGGDFSWALGHPETLTDYAYRAVHELTVVGKAITTARYGKEPERSYWSGCSTGGRQGLKEAQRFPEDYDAIIAGAPASNWSALMSFSVAVQRNMTGADGLGVDKLGALKEAAIAACDAGDGVADRVIAEPAMCTFDPASTQCTTGNTVSCLSATEVAAAKRIYAGLVDNAGKVVFPGTGPGSEPLWAAYASPQFAIGTSYFRNVVVGDQSWDPATFDVDADVARAEAQDGGAAKAMDADLSAFVARGGKLLTYHGTTDGLIPYGNSVNYHESVVAALGRDEVEDSVALYLVRGWTLQWRRGRVRHRLDRRTRRVGRDGRKAYLASCKSSGDSHGPARNVAEQAIHATRLRVSASRTLQGRGRQRGCGQLGVCCAVTTRALRPFDQRRRAHQSPASALLALCSNVVLRSRNAPAIRRSPRSADHSVGGDAIEFQDRRVYREILNRSGRSQPPICH
jgi:hypothetical protein